MPTLFRIALIVAAFAGGAFANLVFRPVQAEEAPKPAEPKEAAVPDVLRAHKFELIDASGKTVAILGEGQGRVALRLLPEKDGQTALFAAGGEKADLELSNKLAFHWDNSSKSGEITSFKIVDCFKVLSQVGRRSGTELSLSNGNQAFNVNLDEKQTKAALVNDNGKEIWSSAKK